MNCALGMLSIAPRGLFLAWSIHDELFLYRELTSCQRKRAIKHPFTKHQLEPVFVQLFGEKEPLLVKLDIIKFIRMALSTGLNIDARLEWTQAFVLVLPISAPLHFLMWRYFISLFTLCFQSSWSTGGIRTSFSGEDNIDENHIPRQDVPLCQEEKTDLVALSWPPGTVGTANLSHPPQPEGLSAWSHLKLWEKNENSKPF